MAADVIARGGYALNANDIVGELSIAKQQLVEIARASAFNCSVVIFDEPTASLSGAEAEMLYGNVERLAAAGVAIVYISHRMSEVFRLSHRISVLRDGKSQGTLETAATNLDAVTRLMIGRTLDGYVHRPATEPGDPLLELVGVGVPGYFDAIDLTVRSGEILGLYGLVGAGRSELAEVVFGLRESSGGEIRWQGMPVRISSPRDAMQLGIGFVPEDRKLQGLMLGLGGQDNMVLSILDQLSLLGLTRRRKEHAVTSAIAKRSVSSRPPPAPMWASSVAVTSKRSSCPNGSPPGPSSSFSMSRRAASMWVRNQSCTISSRSWRPRACPSCSSPRRCRKSWA